MGKRGLHCSLPKQIENNTDFVDSIFEDHHTLVVTLLTMSSLTSVDILS